MEKKEFKIVNGTYAEVTECVTVNLNQGWELVGGISVTSRSNGSMFYAQAIAKNNTIANN
jgi:hypothetical protein